MSLGSIHRRPVHPLVALREAERALDRVGRRAAHPRRVASDLQGQAWSPRLEAIETEDGFEVTAEMPGVARDALEVSVQEGVLTIKGARRFGASRTSEPAAEAPADSEVGAKAESGDEGLVRFERHIRFNQDVDEAAIVARYADGVLEVRVPKSSPPEPEVRTIPVEVG